MSSSRYKPSKEKRKATKKAAEAEKVVRELSPSEQRKETIIKTGVFILVIAFMMTSGIVCVNLNPESESPQQQQTRPVDELQQGVERWKEELAQNPDDPSALANLAFYYNKQAQRLVEDKDKAEREKLLTNAITHLDKAIEKDPDYTFAYVQKSFALQGLGNKEEARTVLDNALEKATLPGEDAPVEEKAAAEGNRVQVLTAMAGMEIESENFEAALSHLDEAVQIKPGEGSIHLQRALALGRLGRRDEAEKALDMAVDIGQKMRDRQTLFLAEGLRREMFPDSVATPDVEGSPAIEVTPGDGASPEAPATPAVELSPSVEATPEAGATPAVEATPLSPTPNES